MKIRNSANRYNIDTANDSFSSQNNSYAATNRSNFDSELDSQFSGETDNKFDTGPSIRGSAKNRRRLDKMFAISSNTNSNYDAPPNSNTNLFDSKNFRSNPNIPLNNYRKDNKTNSYLAKLNPSENSTSRYSPSNPESGIFSISDYENSNNQFIRLEKSQNNPELKKLSNGTKEAQNKTSSTNIEYKPLAGVSFKPSHPSDVEIVGVKLGNQANQDQYSAINSNSNTTNPKKKNSLKCTLIRLKF
ncbi:hypothetical protein BpHYR1_050759 [Brachionus plicatilis]|uniref:Uncharacterized protein n=1 Tax=Brachionus plicatilis TaxID=10195 RepID=A0A3M7P9E3_BRAPC|nr:hypothetical protein BpHYR1_050759 [Brachionus plicatilis]